MHATTQLLSSSFKSAAGGCTRMLTLVLSVVVVLGVSLLGSETDRAD
ncbi:MAG: hypothetical protein M3O01_11440 [Pseudomonadota bacterium]|nr:hypothetical protein [Pseudomonadota bacterium]